MSCSTLLYALIAPHATSGVPALTKRTSVMATMHRFYCTTNIHAFCRQTPTRGAPFNQQTPPRRPRSRTWADCRSSCHLIWHIYPSLDHVHSSLFLSALSATEHTRVVVYVAPCTGDARRPEHSQCAAVAVINAPYPTSVMPAESLMVICAMSPFALFPKLQQVLGATDDGTFRHGQIAGRSPKEPNALVSLAPLIPGAHSPSIQ